MSMSNESAKSKRLASEGEMSKDEIKEAFKDFIENYKVEGEKIYLRKIKDIVDTLDEKSIVFDGKDLSSETSLVEYVIFKPEISIDAAEKAIRDMIKEYRTKEMGKKEIHARFKNLPIQKTSISKIGTDHIGRMTQIEGILNRVSDIKPLGEEITFKCAECENEMVRTQEPWLPVKANRPHKCNRMDCGAGKSKLYIDDAKLINYRGLRIQEKPEKLKGGETPSKIKAVVRDDLARESNTPKPGDRITAVAQLKKIKPSINDRPLFGKVLEINHIESQTKEMERIEISDEEEEKIQELAQDPNVLNKIRDSIAPAIKGHERIKEALGLTLFGGAKLDLPDGTTLRGNSNVLIVGDPGTGKSVILKYIENLVPRGMYTSGKSSTGAGLTAAAVKDEITDSWALEAGALVLSDGGICAIDEFDKMGEKDRSSIHEAMEQGTVSVAKAGISATLNARTSIIAGANPRHGRFDPYKPVSDQVNLSPTILSRFDLVFKIVDQPDEKKDKEIAEHVLGVRKNKELVEPPIEPELFKKYISYARKKVNPNMTDEAVEKIKNYYVGIRNMYKDQEDTPIPITARQLESLIRLAESHARIRLRDEVRIEDATETINLMDKVLKEMGMDPQTEKMDADIIMTGESKSQRDKAEIIEDIIGKVAEESENDKADMKDILKAADEAGIEKKYARHLIDKMKERGDIIESRPGKYQTI